jgi:hypothetical protein
MTDKLKIIPFNDLPKEERIKIIYYMEMSRMRGMDQILHLLKDEIGQSQKKKILNYMQDIADSLAKEYEVIKK